MVFKVSVIVLTFLTSLGTPFLLHAQEEPPSEVVPEQPAPPVDSTVASDVQEPPVVQEFGPQSDAGDMGMMSPMPDMGDQMLMSDPMGQPGSVLEQSAQPVPEKTPEEVAAQREVMSIDTVSVDEPSGNWLFKRIWYEKAEDEYGKLKELSSIVAQERMKFFAERTKLDRELFDPFYKNLGYGMGELQEMLTTIIENMEQERAGLGFLADKKREILGEVESDQKLLEQLHMTLAGITKLDNALDDALEKLLEQINRAQEYEKQAWQAFEGIAQELNDDKARAAYYTVENCHTNMRNIHEYIINAFNQHFNKLVDTAYNEVSHINDLMKITKDRGINFKQKVKELENVEQEQVEEKAQDIVDEYKEKKEEDGMSWKAMLSHVFTTLVDTLKKWFSRVGETVQNMWFKLTSSVSTLSDNDDEDDGQFDEQIEMEQESAPLPEVSVQEVQDVASEPEAPEQVQMPMPEMQEQQVEADPVGQ